MNAGSTPTLLTVKEAAEVLRISERSVYNLISAGTLKSLKIAGRRRVPSTVIDELVAKAIAS